MGIELASHILAGLLIGWLLDKWLGTEPVWLIVGTITGVVVGMTDFIRAALKAQKRITEQRPVIPSGTQADTIHGNKNLIPFLANEARFKLHRF